MGSKNKSSSTKDKKPKKGSSVKDEQKKEDITKQEEEVVPSKSVENAKEHKSQLQRLPEKDPEFYEFLKENAKELLDFDEEEDAETDMDDEDTQEGENEDDPMDHADGLTKKENIKTITSEMVDTWIKAIQEENRIGAIRNIMRAFRFACHCGDDDSESKLTSMSFPVFNKILLFVLSEMDGIFRKLLKLPLSGGKKEMILELVNTRAWKNYNHLVKGYLSNALHVLNQMTDTVMIAFTLRRLKFSSLFLAAFPSLLRKYIKVVLHFWGTGTGVLPIVSLLFLRDVCIRLGSDCIDECFKGIYKAYVLNCHFVNATKLQHVQFLGNCVIELYRVDLPSAYQHAFGFIRQLASYLQAALTIKRKDTSRRVYEWKFMNCLQLWTGAVCAYGSEADFKPLAYPLTQIISGVVRLLPTAKYLPLRLRCIRMLNQIAVATNTFIPVAVILTDMLDMKELHKPPTGGVGKAVDLRTILKVNKATLKTRSFQESIVFSVIEELAEHLAQWSYSLAFFELSFVPAVRLRNFCKSTKVERFRRDMRQLIREIEANSEFTNKKRMSISSLPNDPASSSFMEVEKKKGVSPLSKYVATLRQKAQERTDSLVESSVIVGEKGAIFGKKRRNRDDDDDDEMDDDDDDVDLGVEGADVFSSEWLPSGDHKAKNLEDDKKEKKGKKQKKGVGKKAAIDEDVVEDFVLSSDDEESSDDDDVNETEEVKKKVEPVKQGGKKQKPSEKPSKRKGNFRNKNRSKKKKTAN